MTVSQELLGEIRALLPVHMGVRELSGSESAEFEVSVQRRFVQDSDALYWWDSLRTESVSLDYGDADGLAWLGKLIPSGQDVRLFVTDDEPGPWPAFAGEFGALKRLVDELHYFEFFFVGENRDWVIFDTHHNTLVVTGNLLERARGLGDGLAG